MILHHFLPHSLLLFLRNQYTSNIHAKQFRISQQYLIDSANDVSFNSLLNIHSLSEWQVKRLVSREKLSWMLGLPITEVYPNIKVCCTSLLHKKYYTIEKIVFQTIPGFYVTANFYLPHDRPSTLPCVIYLNGHWPSLDGAKTGFQDRYLWYPVNGFALVVIDPIGFGEFPGVHPGMAKLSQWHWLSLGYTPAGVEVWNAMRVIDWLESRSEIDPARIGVTGISGGGVMTQFLAALDDRVAVAAPSCSTYTIGSQVTFGLISEQCDCTFYPNVYQIDFPEVLALIAPRPLLILGGRKDPIFPPAGFREAFKRTSRIYDLYQDAGNYKSKIKLVESCKGHTDPPNFLSETHNWMCKWLRDFDKYNSPIEVQSPKPESSKLLRCSFTFPQTEINSIIHDHWIQTNPINIPISLEEWSSRKSELLKILRSRVFGWFPKHEILFNTKRHIASGGYIAKFANFSEYQFDSEERIPVNASLITPKAKPGPLPCIIWVKGPSDHVTFPDLDEFYPFLRTHVIVVLTPRFSHPPLSPSNYARIERTAALIGRSIAAMRIWDILRAVSWLTKDRNLKLSEITVYGCKDQGILVLYAALFDLTISNIVLRNPTVTHFEGPALPTILRYTDIPEIAGLLSPRRLTILSHRKEGFEFTQSIYNMNKVDCAFSYANSLVDGILVKSEKRNTLNEEKEISC